MTATTHIPSVDANRSGIVTTSTNGTHERPVGYPDAWIAYHTDEHTVAMFPGFVMVTVRIVYGPESCSRFMVAYDETAAAHVPDAIAERQESGGWFTDGSDEDDFIAACAVAARWAAAITAENV